MDILGVLSGNTTPFPTGATFHQIPLVALRSIDIRLSPLLVVFTFTSWHRLWFVQLRRSIRRKHLFSDCVKSASFLVVTAACYDVRPWPRKRTGCVGPLPTSVGPSSALFAFAPWYSGLKFLLQFREHVGVVAVQMVV
jgi:hypothetical protein